MFTTPLLVAETTRFPFDKLAAYASFNAKPIYHWLPFVTDEDGVIKYTFTVGTTAGMTAGTYSGIVDFTALTAVAATKATPTYKLSTGGDTTTNADVLKSIVALIASINKQIQALQKLILKR